MKIQIKKVEWERKDVITEVDINPEQRYYFFGRRAYSVKPCIDNESEYNNYLHIVSVDCEENIIKSKSIPLTQIGQYLDDVNSWYWEILKHYLNHYNSDTRTKERFDSDFKSVIDIITKNVTENK